MSYGKGISYRNKQKKNIVLFDMDGTLTEARRPIGIVMVRALRELVSQDEHAHQRPSVEIGVVTGSDLVYVKEQMKPLFEKDYDLAKRIHWLPCNGTKYYKFDGGNWEVLHSVDMRTSVGAEIFNDLMHQLLIQQEHISALRIPLTGHFIDYRGSMINWCPIGRNANDEDRRKFIEMDTRNEFSIRDRYLARLRIKIATNRITCKLGGDTSFDIYPADWDKSYCLKYFEEYNKFFVGDRCFPNGNDHEIFQAISGNSWSTKSPTETVRIINEYICPLVS